MTLSKQARLSTSMLCPRISLEQIPRSRLEEALHRPTCSASASSSSTATSIVPSMFGFSSGYSDGSGCPLSRSETPVKAVGDEEAGLSDSSTPVNEDLASLDPDQITLRLYLHAAVTGNRATLPKWPGLADALRIYFADSWHRDAYTVQECEKLKSDLFWVAVAEEKWRKSEMRRQGKIYIH